jgi:hypothetical protein
LAIAVTGGAMRRRCPAGRPWCIGHLQLYRLGQSRGRFYTVQAAARRQAGAAAPPGVDASQGEGHYGAVGVCCALKTSTC